MGKYGGDSSTGVGHTLGDDDVERVERHNPHSSIPANVRPRAARYPDLCILLWIRSVQ